MDNDKDQPGGGSKDPQQEPVKPDTGLAALYREDAEPQWNAAADDLQRRAHTAGQRRRSPGREAGS